MTSQVMGVNNRKTNFWAGAQTCLTMRIDDKSKKIWSNLKPSPTHNGVGLF